MNTSFSMTSNRRAILLNFSLICLFTLISYMIFQDLLMTFLGGLFSSFVLRVLFSKGNMREFGKSQTIEASNGKIFSRKHKTLVVTLLWSFLAISWAVGVFLKPYIPDLLPQLVTLFMFQILMKGTLFFLDLPIGTFHEDQSNVRSVGGGVTSHRGPDEHSIINSSRNDIYYSPAYKSLSCNIYHNR